MSFKIKYTKLEIETSRWLGKYPKGTYRRWYYCDGVECEQAFLPDGRILFSFYEGTLIKYFSREEASAVGNIINYINKHKNELYPEGFIQKEESHREDKIQLKDFTFGEEETMENVDKQYATEKNDDG